MTSELQAIEKMKSAAVESMKNMPAAERELILNRLLSDAQRSVLSANYPALMRLHDDLLRHHNTMLANERINAMRNATAYVPPPTGHTIPQPAPAHQSLYSDAQFAREQQRGWLAFGMIIGGTGALVAFLHAAPLATAGLIAVVLFIKYVTAPKPKSEQPPSSGPTQVHHHYHNTQNIYQK